MTRYKTVLTDYEGLQDALESHSEQDWKLVSANPDTWRKAEVIPGVSEMMGSASADRPAEEYSASYYLLIFSREEDLPHGRSHEAATISEDLPAFTM